MSDVMLFGVLEMPYEMAMEGEISRKQFYACVQEAVVRLKEAEALNVLQIATIDNLTAAKNAAEQRAFDLAQKYHDATEEKEASAPVAPTALSDVVKYTRLARGIQNPTWNRPNGPYEDFYACDDVERALAVAHPLPAEQGAAPQTESFDFVSHLARQAAWSENTFGPGMRTAGVCDHIRKELREIEADPSDLKEWIDVVILALDGAWRCGGKPQEIIDNIVAKQKKNEGRTWPDWRTADPNKAIEHDRSGEAAPQQQTQSLPKWIDNAKGRDSFTDDLIAYIEGHPVQHNHPRNHCWLQSVRIMDVDRASWNSRPPAPVEAQQEAPFYFGVGDEQAAIKAAQTLGMIGKPLNEAGAIELAHAFMKLRATPEQS